MGVHGATPCLNLGIPCKSPLNVENAPVAVDNEGMKRTLLASAAAVLVSSALLVSPAAAAETPTSSSALSPTLKTQPVSKSSSGGMSTMGMGSGANVFWCWFGIC
jgi:hypothetical protein